MDKRFLPLLIDAFPRYPLPERPVTGHRCPECDEVDRLLADCSWLDVAREFPRYCHDAFPLLTPAAKAYYFPTYMLVSLDQRGGLAGTSLESALEDGQLNPERFTPAQRAAVRYWAAAYWRLTGQECPPAGVVEKWT